MTGAELENLCISIQGRWNRIRISKNVVRVLGSPDYVCLRVNEKLTSFAIMPCDSKDLMSFRVPPGLSGYTKKDFNIYSKAFIVSILEANDFDITRTYRLYGKYSNEKNAVIFRMLKGTVQINDRL
jgi:hypothetical protein